MCGRFAFFSLTPQVLDELGVTARPAELRPRYNIAPTDQAAVVLSEGRKRMLKLMRWGLVPRWAKDPSIGSRMINARAETLAQKPAFRDALRKRRCLVPADGFYEWKKEGKGKRPFFIRPADGKPLALAGLWESWPGQQGPLETFAIVTCPANRKLSALHDRMPAIIAPADFGAWLNADGDDDKALSLLVPAPEDLLESVPVSPRVNNPANDDARLLDPVT